MIRPFDIVIVLGGALLVASLATSIYAGGTPTTLRVSHGRAEPVDYTIDENRRIRVDGPLGTTVIEVKDGRARFVESPCTRKLCIRSGWFDDVGEGSACVPNRVSTTLLGADARFDAMSF